MATYVINALTSPSRMRIVPIIQCKFGARSLFVFRSWFSLFAYVFLDSLLPDFGAIYVALCVSGNAFWAARGCERTFVDVRIVVGNERCHLTVSRAADPDTAFPLPMLARFVRLRVGDVNDIVLVDVHAA